MMRKVKFSYLNFNKVLKVALKALGRHISRRPYIFIILSCITSVILGMGIMVSEYEELSPEYLSISGGRFEEGRKLMKTYFPINSSKNFDPARITDFPVGPIVYILNKKGGSMLAKSVFRDIDRLDKFIRNASIETNKGVMKYANICAKDQRICFNNPMMKLIPKIDDILAGNFTFKFPVTVDNRTFDITPYAMSLGGVTTDSDGYVKDFSAVRLFYFGDESDFSKKIYIKQWEKSLLKKLVNLEFETIEVLPVAISAMADDIQQVNRRLFPLAGVMALVVVVYSMASFITNSWTKSKFWLGAAAGVSAALAIMSAYGAMFYAGIRNTDLTVLVALVVLGTEIDDAFIMVASWRTTNPKETVQQRMEETYSEAAVSVTLSSLTSFIAYCIGIAAPMAVVHNICIQCAICILFTYLYQLLFFGPFLAVDGYREHSERDAFVLCQVNSNKNTCEKEANKTGIEKDEETVMKFMRDVFGALLKFPLCKAVCLLLFATNITFASLSLLSLQQGSEVSDILSKKSHMRRAYDTELGRFAAFQHMVHIVFNGTLNYWDKDVQESIENMMNELTMHPNIADSSFTISWLKFYKIFAEHPLAKSSLMSYDIAKKENFLHGLRRIFLRLKLTRQFKNDIHFNENFTEITKSRFIVLCANLSSPSDEAKLMEYIDAIVQKSKLPIIIYSSLFVQGEQASIIGQVTVKTVWITALLMFVVFLIFIANIPHAFFVAISVSSSMIGTLGFMAAWGIKLDILTLIIVVTCLGFSINYSAHMSYAFTTSQADTAHEKLKESIYRVGLPVIQGSLSTIIAVSILLLQDMYIYVACFKVIFLTVMETAFHALIVLPVVFCIFDTCTNCSSKLNKKNEYDLRSSHVIESYYM